jgi:hypothetical protein
MVLKGAKVMLSKFANIIAKAIVDELLSNRTVFAKALVDELLSNPSLMKISLKYFAQRSDPYMLMLQKVRNEATNFISEHGSQSMIYKINELKEFWSHCLEGIKITPPAMALEFGVFKGTSINFFSSQRPDLVFHGFDSFKGLPENWTGNKGHSKAGRFSLNGNHSESQ